MTVKDVIEYPRIVVGGGATEAFISQKLREWASSLSGRIQMVCQKFADSVEVIPQVLAENAGMNWLDTQAQIRSNATVVGADGKAIYGIDVMSGKIEDMAAKGVMNHL